MITDYDPVEEAPAPLIDDNAPAKVYVGNHARQRRSLQEKNYIDRSIEVDDKHHHLNDEDMEFQEFIRHDERRHAYQTLWHQDR